MTNKAYVANRIGDGTVTIVDGANYSIASVSLGNGTWPTAIAINPVTKSVYVADAAGNSVSVIADAQPSGAEFLPVNPRRVAHPAAERPIRRNLSG